MPRLKESMLGLVVTREFGIFPGSDELDFLRIKYSDETVMGSDAWGEKMIPFQVMMKSIFRYRNNFLEFTRGMEPFQQEAVFLNLLETQLRNDLAFIMTENGCGEKYLQLQPIHRFILGFVDGNPWFSPADLRQFGDHAKSFIETNKVVGQGLWKIYREMGEKGVGTAAAIMSGQKNYLNYLSKTDVWDHCRIVATQDGLLVGEGQYWMLGRTLSPEKQYWLHNFIATIGKDNINLSLMDEAEEAELVWRIKTDALLITDNSLLPDYELMVKNPNTYLFPTHLEDFFDLALVMNRLFKLRFGEPLLDDMDIQMYAKINELVDYYLPVIREVVWKEQSAEKWYENVRIMLYHCQAEYTCLKARQHGMADYDIKRRVRTHLDDLMLGRIMPGFEVGITDPMGFNDPLTLPLGYQEFGTHFCDKHQKIYQNFCPDCKKYGYY